MPKQLRLITVLILFLFIYVNGGNISHVDAQSTPTKPILVVVNDSATNKFGRYLGEILKAEGLNNYDVNTITAVDNTVLSQYQVVVLAETPLTAGQATTITNYVNGGGYLIAMRPDSQIAGLFGLGASQGTQADGYMKMSGTGPSQGLSTATLQIHGTVDRYTLSGASTLAQLYSNATTTTAYPAVAQSANGHGTAFLYDLPTNIVYMRQGNPANANVDADGDGILRSIDLFVGAGGSSPWVDLDKMPIPQADEQQRFFARLVQQAVTNYQPMPQLWYFPGTSKTMMVLTGDAHFNPISDYQNEITLLNNLNVDITIYLSLDFGITDADVQTWRSQGHEFGIHPYTYRPDTYEPFNILNLAQGYDVYTNWFNSKFSSPMSRTVRNHQVAWFGWTDAADTAVAHGLAMDTNFYNWGPWLQKPNGSWADGYVTGSGQPMKFIRADGTILPYYQQLTQLVDEQMFNFNAGYEAEGLSTPAAIQLSQQIIDSSEAGDYAALMTQFHVDYINSTSSWVTGTVSYAQNKGIPVWNADEWLSFTETRHDATYSNMAWNSTSKTLSFNLAAAATPGMTLTTVLPVTYGANNLQTVTVDGSPTTFTYQTIKGSNVAFVTVPAGNHTFSAVYSGTGPIPTNTPTIAPTATVTLTPSNTPTGTLVPTQTPTNVPTSTPLPTATNTPVISAACFTDDTTADFNGGTHSGTFASEINGGQLILNPTLGTTFSGTSLPSGWVNGGAWQSGGTTTVSGGNLLTNRSRAGSSAAYPIGSSLEFTATFQAAAWQHVGWVGDLDFNSTFAIFSTFNTNNSLYARTSDGTNTLIAGNWIGVPHRYRIDHTATSFVFYIDGNVVATQNYSVSSSMQVIASENSAVSLPVDWVQVSPYASSGTFTSRVFDAAANKNWGTMAWSASGSTIAISVRTGNTAAPDGTWTAFTPVASSGTNINLTGRYIQYQASLSTANTAQTPALDSIGVACVNSVPNNQAPTISANQASVTVNEGQTASNTGTASDPDGDPMTFTASVGTVTFTNGTWSWSYGTTDGPAQSGTVTVTATDNHNTATSTTFSLTVSNVAPTATFSNTSGTISAGQSATLVFSAQTDVSSVDTTSGFLYSYDCTNSGTYLLTDSSSASFNCPYPTAGTYTARARIADKDGGSNIYTVQVVVQAVAATVTPSPTPTNLPLPTATNTPVISAACFIDDTVADFSAGANSGTFVSDNNGGQLVLNPTLGSNFNGTSLPAGWVDAGAWQAGGTTTVSGGNLLTNRSRAGSSVAYAAGSSIEFSATFQAAAWQHVGWVGDLDFNSTFAIFSTFFSNNSLYARTSDGSNILIAGNWIGTAHRYRIDHNATSFVFYIDGNVVATINQPVSGSMQVIASENSGVNFPVDWVQVTPYASSGVFTSRVFDAAGGKSWGAVTWNASGSTINISARTGNTAAPDGTWSAFTPIATSGSSLNLTGRYIQYQASLSTANTAQTPALDNIGFACSTFNQAPVIAANQASVTISEGQTASNSGTASDPNGDAITLTASVGTVTFANGTWSWSYPTADNAAQPTSVTITATDSSNATATTTFSLSVNNVAPTATFTNTTGTINAGQSATLAFSAQADASTVDTSSGFLYSFDCTNSGTFSVVNSTVSSLACTYPTAGTYTARGQIADKDGGLSIYTAQVNVVVPNQAPVIATNQTSVTVNEGQTATNTGTASDPNGDAMTFTASVGTVTFANGTWSWSYATTDGPVQSATVTITATDSKNAATATTFSLTVNNVAPTATFTNTTGSIIAGQSATLAFSAQADASSADTTSGFLYSYDCTNSGTFSVTNSLSVSIACTYPTAGTYTARGQIADKDGGSTIYTAQVVVQAPNQPPVVNANQTTVTVNEGQTATNTGTASDPNGDTMTFTASVGTVTFANGTWSWSYATTDGPNQSTTVTITATDSKNAATAKTFTLTVNNVAPTATFTNTTGGITAGQTATLAFSSQVDPSTADTTSGFLYSYDCTNSGTFSVTNSSSASLACSYPTSGSFTARGQIADKNGGATIYTAQVVVQPVATACLIDDTVANFTAGLTGFTDPNIFISEANGGQVILKPTVAQTFSGTTLPTGWGSQNLTILASTTVSSSSLRVNGASAGTATAYGVNASLDFVATFPTVANGQAGWASSLAAGTPFAVFSTFNTTNSLYARTSNGTTVTNTLIPGSWLGAPHRFRIDHTATSFVFYIDGNVVATNNLATTATLRAIFSDATALLDSAVLTVDWVQISPFATPGTFVSRVYDATVNKNWSTVNWTASGSTITISARTGNTATPDATWTAYTTIASSGSNLNLSGRYIQYRAVLSTANTAQTPVLDTISFSCANVVTALAQVAGAGAGVITTPTDNPTATPAATEIASATPAPTETASVTPEPTETASVTPEPTETASATPAPTETVEPPATVVPTIEPTSTPEPTLAPVPTEAAPVVPAAVEVPPTAGFTASVSSGPAPLAVTFANQSSGNITSYSWNFGDGGTSSDANPSYTFNSQGTFTVTLTVSGPGGTSSSQTVITVN